MRAIAAVREQDAVEVSPLDLEILRTRLIAQTHELAAALANAAPTVEVSQGKEFAVALVDTAGGIAAIDNPLELGSVSRTVTRILDCFEFDLREGDVVLTNDPHGGGTRVQDITLLSPLVIDGASTLHLLARVRIRDLGGQIGGSVCPTAPEIWAEGVSVPPVKIRKLGQSVRHVLYTFLLNSRRPAETRGTLDAALAAVDLGQRRLTALIGAHGAAAVRAALGHAQNYTEQLTRATIEGWQNGTHTGAAVLEDDPSGGGPLTVRVTADITDDVLRLDFSGSDEQRGTFINCSAGTTTSCALTALLTLLGDAVPANSGLLRAVDIDTGAGTVTGPLPPAPVGWGKAHCGTEIVQAVQDALRRVLPDPCPDMHAPRPLVLSRPRDERGNQTDLGIWAVGGAGARQGADGWGAPQLTARALLPSIEEWETDTPMRLESLEYAPDTSGTGQWAGAPALEATIELAPDQLYTLWTEPVGHSPDGGAPGELVFRSEQGWRPAGAVAVEQPVGGDFLRLRMPGGCGHGRPAARDHSAVRADLADGLITPRTAREVYGVQS